MKKNYKFIFFALLFLVLLGQMICGQKAYADGGQVTTNGVVGFYEESSSEPPTSSTSEPVKASSSDEPKVEKPKGRLPSTGEIVRNPFVWVGTLLTVSVIALFLWRKISSRSRRKSDE